MMFSHRAPLRMLAFALLLTVASQLFYITVVSEAGSDTVLRPITWFTELFAFLAVAVAGLTLAICKPQQGMIWPLVALSGVFNVLQVAIGLSMFGPALEGGEAEPQLFATVLAGAFFLYFLAKLMLGGVGIVLGAAAIRLPTLVAKVVGGLTLLSGLAALILNFLAMIDSKAWMFAAGASGTAATALLAILLLVTGNATTADDASA